MATTSQTPSMPPAPTATAFQRLQRALPLLISAALLAVVLWHFDGWGLLKRLDSGLFALALGLALLLDTGVGAFKWWWILRRLRQPVSFGAVWRVWTGLLPLTFFTPFQSGHALYPLALSRATGVDLVVATESVIYDKGLSLVSTFALVAVGQGLLPVGHPLVQPWILAVALVGVGAWFLDRPIVALLSRVGQRSPRFARLARRSQLLRHPIPLLDKVGLLLTGMVYQTSDSLSIWLGVAALGLELPANLAFGAYPLALLLSYAPVTFAGFGLREPAAAYALGTALTWDQGVLAGILVDGLEYVAPALFGLTCLPWLLRRLARPVTEARVTRGP